LNHRKDLEELERKFSLSKTVIAVVGDTGAGKSSLMNAVLDQLDILPTSGMRACTAVVAEVISNTENQKYEADITFLSQEV
jgi:predicted GTPase